MEMTRARAMSTDGVHWRIQIESEIFQQPWSSLAIPAQSEHYFAYGVWTKYGDIVRVPIHPSLYAEHVEQHAQELIEQLSRKLEQLPFPAEDRHECWLLDNESLEPVVLIQSSLPDRDVAKTFPRHLRWAPYELNEKSFSASLPMADRDSLYELVNQRVGTKATAIWIDRTTNSVISTNQADRIQAGTESVVLPETLISLNWPTTQQTQLVNDYINWLSPRLLMLPDLNIEWREQLEQQAQLRATEVEKYYRLYPQVLNQPRLNKILVEARLRHAAEEQFA